MKENGPKIKPVVTVLLNVKMAYTLENGKVTKPMVRDNSVLKTIRNPTKENGSTTSKKALVKKY